MIRFSVATYKGKQLGVTDKTLGYRYDSLERRVAKHAEIDGKVEQKRFLWQGLRLLREATPAQNTLYLYEPGSHAALELTDREGRLVWQATYRAWGEVDRLAVNEVEQPLRFQGQYCDGETGLHYNTFRYYEPEMGRFITQDPMGWRVGLICMRMRRIQWGGWIRGGYVSKQL